MKKICQIGYLQYGIGHYIAHLYPELSKYFDISVASFTHSSTEKQLIIDDPIIVENVKKFRQLINPHGWENTQLSINRLFQFFDQEKFDILNIHVSAYTRNTAYIYLPLINHYKQKGMKAVFTFHDVLPFIENKEVTPLLREFYDSSDAAIVGNTQEKELLYTHFKYSQPITIATHGIYSLFNTRKLDQITAKTELNLPQDKKIVLFFGALRDNKGLDTLIDALNILSNSGALDRIHTVISVSLQKAGFEKYEKLIGEYNLSEYITLVLKDYLTPQEIEKQFVAADLIALPYKQVSQSGILNLAFAFEKPVIVTHLFEEAGIIDKNMGYSIEPDNPVKLAEAIISFCDNSRERNFASVIRTYNSTHSFKQTADKYKQLFEEVLPS